jgi:hypothetical protein
MELDLNGSDYVVSIRGGSSGTESKQICCATQDQGKWINWALRYVPDASGVHASTQLWKDGVAVFGTQGVPNAYPGDNDSYLKMGIYLLSSFQGLSQITLLFGPVTIGQLCATSRHDGVTAYTAWIIMPPETSIRWALDPAVVFGQQRSDHGTDVVGHAGTAKCRRVRNQLVDAGIVANHVATEIRGDCAGSDRVDGDPARAKFLRKMARQDLDRAFHRSSSSLACSNAL